MSRRNYIDPHGYVCIVVLIFMYLHHSFLLSGSRCAMDENERDVLDSKVQSFLVTCADHIRRVKKLCDGFDSEYVCYFRQHFFKYVFCCILQQHCVVSYICIGG